MCSQAISAIIQAIVGIRNPRNENHDGHHTLKMANQGKNT